MADELSFWLHPLSARFGVRWAGRKASELKKKHNEANKEIGRTADAPAWTSYERASKQAMACWVMLPQAQ